MNKVLSILTLTVICISMYLIWDSTDNVSAEDSYSGSCGPEVRYDFDPNSGTLTISGTGRMYDYLSGEGPWDSFKESVKSLIIEKNVTTIGGGAFGFFTSLESVTIADSVTYIGISAFYRCTALTSVTIPDSVTTIRFFAFTYCYSLNNITIGKSVSSIEFNVFDNCTSLKSIEVSPENTNYCSVGGVLFNYNKDRLIQYTLGSPNLSYDVPNTVTMIENKAFFNSSFLTSVTIPETVKIISNQAFNSCPALTTITVAENNPNYSSEEGILFNKEKNTLLQYPSGKKDTSYNIPDTVDKVDNLAIYRCEYLTSVNIPQSVSSIGNLNFWSCSALNSIIVNESNNQFVSEEGVLFDHEMNKLIKYPEGKKDE